MFADIWPIGEINMARALRSECMTWFFRHLVGGLFDHFALFPYLVIAQILQYSETIGIDFRHYPLYLI
jgi:hypothetical protein